MPEMTYVGRSPEKEDALAKAVGDTVYGDDLHLPLLAGLIRDHAWFVTFFCHAELA